METRELLTPEIMAAVEQAAKAEHRPAAEVVQDAVRRYLKERHWQMLVRYGQERARELGYKCSDVSRVIAEHRRENSRHER